MIIDFSQGIISYPSSNQIQQFLVSDAGYVNLSPLRGQIDIAFAHGNADMRVANVADGDMLTITVSQGNVTTGIGNVNWPASFKWGAAGAPTINGIADTTWIVTAIYSIEEGIFLCSCSPGY